MSISCPKIVQKVVLCYARNVVVIGKDVNLVFYITDDRLLMMPL